MDCLEEKTLELEQNSRDLMRQAQELRSKLGDRTFDLEREETRSKTSLRSRSSKCSSASSRSELRRRVLAEAARKQIELKYAKVESQKKMELVARECAMEELQKMKEFEMATAEADVLGKVEEEDGSLTSESLEGVEEESPDDHVSRYLNTLPTTCHVDTSPINSQAVSSNNHAPSISSAAYETSTGKAPLTGQDQNHYHTGQNMDSPRAKPWLDATTTLTFHGTQQPLMYGDLHRCKGTQQQTKHYESTPVGNHATPVYRTNETTFLDGPTHDYGLGIAHTIAEGMQAARLPPPELTVFDGDPLNWPTWKSAFEIVVERRAINANEKILYLMQYLSGAPKKIVEGYQFESSPKANDEAKKTLEERFGHSSVVAGAFRDKLEG